ncbi:hypothetical protein [Pseudanabaena sp. UWO310]|uniref:hypothetical protein n=1 Tax=Pseudanabaena sp. UWO310 TaxID=2480795 RepID=UPI001159253C|nr:hypothetical protein [Pseudanabaena sp. UWO310]TYQ25486.1 hypothetical protein PseudUWO310_19055 [Pseudanabaena sp. UWO310]
MTIAGGLENLFKDNNNVFVAGDLFWYPVEGQSVIRRAPDVMVVFGRPKGARGSYIQLSFVTWESIQIIFKRSPNMEKVNQ